MNILLITLLIALVLIALYLYTRSIMRLSGHEAKDEMYLYYREKAFKEVGIGLTVISGTSILVKTLMLVSNFGNTPGDVLRIEVHNDLKYFLVFVVIYSINVFIFQRRLKS